MKMLVSQARLGQNGEPIRIFKIRTMRMGSEADKAFENKHYSQDERVTRLGKILRATGIDELPQLYNVLKGEMAIVGPRPLLEESYCKMKQAYPDGKFAMREKIKPGIVSPVYAFSFSSFNDEIRNEVRFLDEYREGPLKAQFKYFFLVAKNLVSLKIRNC